MDGAQTLQFCAPLATLNRLYPLRDESVFSTHPKPFHIRPDSLNLKENIAPSPAFSIAAPQPRMPVQTDLITSMVLDAADEPVPPKPPIRTQNVPILNSNASDSRARSVSPATLVALTEPFLMAWCFDDEWLDKHIWTTIQDSTQKATSASYTMR